jgi:hypothetical protein
MCETAMWFEKQQLTEDADNWSEKAKRRRTDGTGRMRSMSSISRKFKNGFQTGGQKGARGPFKV